MIYLQTHYLLGRLKGRQGQQWHSRLISGVQGLKIKPGCGITKIANPAYMTAFLKRNLEVTKIILIAATFYMERMYNLS
jgi:hypothetical protein